jgi:hypothetical protein
LAYTLTNTDGETFKAIIIGALQRHEDVCGLINRNIFRGF